MIHMNYRHIYHAGNFADVLKHITLIATIKNLRKLHARLHVLDAFAGAGLYILSQKESRKTQEALSGIVLLMNNQDLNEPSLIKEYKTVVNKYSSTQKVVYPGSPLIIAEYLRKQDSADFCELHKEDYVFLMESLRKSSIKANYSIYNMDAYVACNKVPQNIEASLVLLDPPYEKTDEFDKLFASIMALLEKNANTTIIIWYPIKEYKKIITFYNSLKMENLHYLKVEFCLNNLSSGLKSNGIIIINPPELKEELEATLIFLKTNIYMEKALYNITSVGGLLI
ncbi:MAG: 23S rRNA (adenine(2030)-N(6))-methyltransferase RlmJ [Alphaproteobacteria bacterium]|nr:23S rRNA (adenine(2030)-N(6))-methyltransferase RlmJ [Alphaproteobacteria bacterium]